jgi:hypothetical protein
MNVLFDSFWRAVAYCVHPRVIGLSVLPLVVIVALCTALSYFYWDAAVSWVDAALAANELLATLWSWLDGLGAGALKAVLAPLIVVFAITPVIVFVSLAAVAVLMTPALVSLVAERRFPNLERKQGASLWRSLWWSLGAFVTAALAMVVSIPLWFIPPLVLVLPPLIWGWLTYRVMTFDALADHASLEERKQIFREHRSRLMVMGVVSGFLGAAPGVVWASGALFAAAFVILVPLAIWIYTLVFAFSSLWFTHYALAVLEGMRSQGQGGASLVIDMPPSNPPNPSNLTPAGSTLNAGAPADAASSPRLSAPASADDPPHS